MTGQRVGEWVLGEAVGSGPVATVYRAASADEPGKVAAVKVFTHPELLRPGFTAKFPAEALALRRLQHPSIVAVYGAGVHAGSAWIASEFLDGADAATLLKAAKKPGLPWADEALPLLVQVARALRQGHHRSVLHRGLKPSNVLVTPGGLVKLADFGLAKLLPVPLAALPADALGGLAFQPPEAFAGKLLTRRSDLYSLGCLAYTLLTGRPPFTGASVAEFMHKHCYTLPDRPANIVPDLPAELDDWVCDLLAKDPARRPASAAEAAEGLNQIRAKAERKGRKIPWPPEQPGSVGEINLDDDRIGRGEPGTEGDADPRPLMSRPAVVLPLCAGFVAAVLALVFWPRPTPEELYAPAGPLMASANPADWDRAWADHLEPLSTKFPGEYAAEVNAARAKIEGRRALRTALREGANAKPTTGAARAYRRGLALASAGELAAAEATWQAARLVYAGQPTEAEALAAVDVALAALADRAKPWPHDGGGVSDAELQAARGDAAAKAALEILYAGDPESLTRLRQLPGS